MLEYLYIIYPKSKNMGRMLGASNVDSYRKQSDFEKQRVTSSVRHIDKTSQ